MSGRRIATIHESFDSRDVDAVSEPTADGGSGGGLRDQPFRSQLLGLCLCAFYASFLIAGLTLLGLSAWLLGIRLWTCPVFAAYYAPMWIFLASGILLLASGMLGLLFICCMQQRYQQQPEHQQQPEQQQQQALMQQVTTVLLALLVLSVCGLFGTLVLSAKYGNEAQARDTAQEVQSLFVQAKLDYMDGLNRGEGGGGGAGSSSSLSTTASSVLLCWESLQSIFGCCGAESYADWYSYRNGTRYYDSPRPSVPTSFDETVTPSDLSTSDAPTPSESSSTVEDATTTASGGTGTGVLVVAELILIAPSSCTCPSHNWQQSGSYNGSGGPNCVPVSGLSLNGKSSSSPYRVHGQGCIGPVKFAVRQHMAVMTSACPVAAILVLAHFLFACLLPRLSQRPDSRCMYTVDTAPHPTAYIAQTNKRYDVTAFGAGPSSASQLGLGGDRTEAF
ncbi:hypothetical protein BOX15_Mlig014626g1 [Macrostomum lignano]|uniref:Tetraspanin n=1 Tax=Macrostomum lignano TaxID=282301 RepID=A0A267F7U3_9PLAT|nr:hypothetical protein BOX15_Mlig014626g1 [Macrostomum lignano]